MPSELFKRIKTEMIVARNNITLIIFIWAYNLYFLTFPIKNYIFYLQRPINDAQIVDFFHNHIPEVKDKNIQDTPQSILYILSTFLFVLVPICFKKFHKMQTYAVKNFLLLGILCASIFTIRYCTFFITILPDPNYKCRYYNQIPKPRNLSRKVSINFTFY